jgi:hypothetical protein
LKEAFIAFDEIVKPLLMTRDEETSLDNEAYWFRRRNEHAIHQRAEKAKRKEDRAKAAARKAARDKAKQV